MSKEDMKMSKTDTKNQREFQYLRQMIESIPYRYHLKIHKMYNITVPDTWQIEHDRRNDDLHMVYVKGGSGHYFLKDEKEQLCQGKMIFVSNGYGHSAKPDLKNLPSIIPIRFGIYDNILHKQVQLFAHPFSFSILPELKMNFREKFEQLYAHYLKIDTVGYEQIGSSLLYEILANILNWFNKAEEASADDRIERIKKSMDEQPDHRLTINEWAKKVGMSPKHCTRLFREQIGVTPKKYQIHAAIRYAEFLLEDTDLTIAEVARQLRYPDLYSFSKQYKKVTGFSPGQMRKGGATHA